MYVVTMIYFQCDYAEGADPAIIERLSSTNMEQSEGYGLDKHSMRAKELIKKRIGKENADVHLLVGGTETNRIAIQAALRPYQGVLSPDTGHIAAHETGAIESTGHKVLTLPNIDGKINADQVRAYVKEHYDSPTAEHTVQPAMVYISEPTESGTMYSKKELIALREATKELGLFFYIDGARLGYALASPKCDFTIEDIADLADMFYIGGTKCGALFGEALVILNDQLKKDFRYMIKQNGALLAKGRMLGIQFETLFEDDRYFNITKKAVEKALRIREAFEKKRIPLFGTSYTNQQFPILSDEQIKALEKDYVFELWGKSGDKTIVRFCTSWATSDENTEKLISSILSL